MIYTILASQAMPATVSAAVLGVTVFAIVVALFWKGLGSIRDWQRQAVGDNFNPRYDTKVFGMFPDRKQ